MLESGSSGSVRGVLSNEHPYREPGSPAVDGDLAGRLPFYSRKLTFTGTRPRSCGLLGFSNRSDCDSRLSFGRKSWASRIGSF